MLEAEELGVSSQNVDQMKDSTNPNIRRLVGVEGEIGKGFGLPNDFAYQIIKQVGNYGEVFERNLGTEHAAEDPARHQCAVDQGRPPVSMPFR